MMRRVLIVTLGMVGCLHAAEGGAQEAVSFDRHILPILSSKCFQCHGPDAEARKADLRLDQADSAASVITAGDPAQSELIRRVTSVDPESKMPPPETGDALSEEELARLTEWVGQGAPWARHWAFVPPQRPELPAVSRQDWIRTPIDHFVLARLDAEGLAPSPSADKLALLRRLSLDLTGLPPAIEEVKRVEADTSEGWYAALVERLLASPHYGERWARHWLDVSQFADSDGFEKDKPRQVHAWRDWVIKAFNENKPFDRFVLEQVAGDMLPGATQEQRIATGFLRNSMINEEGGIEPEQFRMEAQFNRMEIIGRAVLGLTVQCAQCHTHKYDPLTQTEYYRMMAFLNNTHEAILPVFSPAEQAQRDDILRLLREVEESVKQRKPDWPEHLAAWEEAARALPDPAWETLAFEFDDSSAGGQKCILQEDGSYLAQGYAPTQFQPKMTAKTTLPRITAVLLELLPDPNLPCGGPGRSIHGTCALSEFELRIAPEGTPIADYDAWTPVKIASALADVNPPQRKLGPEYPLTREDHRVTGPVEMSIDGKSETAWTTDLDPGRRNQARHALFKLAEPLAVPPGHALAFRIAQQHGGWNSDDNQTNNLGRFRVSVTGADQLPGRALPLSVHEALRVAPPDRTAEQQRAVFHQWLADRPEFSADLGRIDALWQALPTGVTQLVFQEREVARATHRLERGDFLSPAEQVTPGTPAMLHALETQDAPNRLDFAHWLVSREAPTTARAFVNRVWLHYFGHGFTDTTSDLGTQGDAPSHPELLDWLAVEFMDSGWDIKALHRLIVSSATYQQHSAVHPDLLARDPANRLLARGARFRVEGETVRDISLAASGLLNPAIGGPSVYPPAPEFLFVPPASYGPKIWKKDTGADQYRRALYTFRFRSVPHPALQVFDTPAGDAPCTRRERSNSPLQALATLNEPLFFACARGLAEAVLKEGGDTAASRMEYAFRRCVARSPEAGEGADLRQFLDKQRQRIDAGELIPGDILQAGGWKPGDSTQDPAELAAWTLTARVLLNMDETITRQ